MYVVLLAENVISAVKHKLLELAAFSVFSDIAPSACIIIHEFVNPSCKLSPVAKTVLAVRVLLSFDVLVNITIPPRTYDTGAP